MRQRWLVVAVAAALFLPLKVLAVEPICPGGSSPDPNVIWCDDFEDSVPLQTKYFDYTGSTGAFVRAPGVGLGGGYAMQAHWLAGQADAGHFIFTFGRSPVNSQIDPTTDFSEIYWRFYVMMQPGWTGNPQKLTRATVFADPTWSQAMIAHLWGTSSSGDYLYIDPASGIDANGNLVTSGYNDFAHLTWLGAVSGTTPLYAPAYVGGWHCVEAHVKLNTPGLSDGVFEYWIDGTLQARRADLNWTGTWRSYGLNAIMFENYWNGGAPGDRTRYLDNIVVSRHPIGGIQNGAPPDTTPPAAISDLQAK